MWMIFLQTFLIIQAVHYCWEHVFTQFRSMQIFQDILIWQSGLAKLFGFNLMQNFAYPYFSRDITEFWKRWHISLTTWFRDYLFLPISFSILMEDQTRKSSIYKVRFIYLYCSKCYNLVSDRSMAWCKLYIHNLGIDPWIITNYLPMAEKSKKENI